jgi:UDP-N-acetylglucosamine diphosphorylase / glucose-1-phosphate thymidylyltransferase / UDP-N-acetylgalactosamine diphosphorylase / glucosamine-1-phosphate N-acetyltransferase / galactosamine-1-phosphate N-acetyltransferase
MQAVIIAAGEGVRMRPLTHEVPKPLLEVHGKPLLGRLVEAFPEEISELVIVVGYKADLIKAHCGRHFFGRPVKYITQSEKRGTYQALELAKPLLGHRPFAVFFADDLLDHETIAELVKYPLAVVTAQVEDPRAFGVIELTPSGHIKSIVEKPERPTSNTILTTAYMLTRDIFDYAPEQKPNGEFYLSEALGAMAKKRPIKTVPAKFWFPISTPEDLQHAHHVVSV